jgi:hypothetical protein
VLSNNFIFQNFKKCNKVAIVGRSWDSVRFLNFYFEVKYDFFEGEKYTEDDQEASPFSAEPP